MNDDVKNFLESIKGISEDTIKVYVPSAKKDVDVKPLSFKQQKEIISTVAEGVVGAIKFQKILNQIIIDNYQDCPLTDKSAIIVALRKNSIGDLKLEESEIDLDEVIGNFKKTKIKSKDKITDKINVDVRIPTLSQENKILNSLIETFKKSGDDVGKNISQIYSYEIIKFIDKISVEETEISFSDLKVSDMVDVVDNLPLSLNKKIIEFIQNYKNADGDALKIGEHQIEIDVSFFDS